MEHCSFYSDVVNVLVCCGEEETEPKGRALDLPLDLWSYSQLWSRAGGQDPKDKMPDKSS